VKNILAYLDTTKLASPLPQSDAQIVAAGLGQLCGMVVYPDSVAAIKQALLFFARQDDQKFLGVLTAATPPANFTGEAKAVKVDGQDLTLTICPANAPNAAALRSLLPYLVAKPLGLKKSGGSGDRLGLATPGHIRSFAKSSMAPILTQQSIRENARTGRTPQEVMDDAMWGVFQSGWRKGFGADADHLKNTDDIDICAAAGYTFYTVDPGEYVDNSANTAAIDELSQKIATLPWDVLNSSPADLEARLADTTVDLGDFSVTISRENLLRAAAKYGRAVAHTVSMYRHLVKIMGDRPFELEMSVDETDTITSLAEHIYIVNELKRLEVKWVSLAPRYVGDFEKGVDYIGDLDEFEQSFAKHHAIAQKFGPYKLSLHSGSDKFSIYPIASKVAGELVHLKTAGTSYLEALRAIAALNPSLFRQIVAFAMDRYPTDRATYHVSAELEKAPDVTQLADDELMMLLDDFHSREILHVTFGSVLHHPSFRQPFFDTLRGDEEVYYQILEKHFDKHLQPFE
jgi:hypothetical protein